MMDNDRPQQQAQDRRPAVKHGHVTVIYGSMFAGKTGEEIRQVISRLYGREKVLVATWHGDTRYDHLQQHKKNDKEPSDGEGKKDGGSYKKEVEVESWYPADQEQNSPFLKFDWRTVCTHTLQRMRAVAVHRLMDLTEALDAHPEITTVAIDEAQFFPDLLQFCELQATVANRVVIAAGLALTYEGKGFGDMPMLIAMAERTVPLLSSCQRCGSLMGCRSFRVKDETKKAGDRVDIDIGGADKYEARCRHCFPSYIDWGPNQKQPAIQVEHAPVQRTIHPVGPRLGVAAPTIASKPSTPFQDLILRLEKLLLFLLLIFFAQVVMNQWIPALTGTDPSVAGTVAVAANVEETGGI